VSEREGMPNAEKAIIDRNKIVGYLLSTDHPVGKFKAKFFIGLGFNPDKPEQLEEQLRAIAKDGLVVDIVHSPFGTKYIVDGWLMTPNGNRVFVRTVWVIEHGDDKPRFVTAYPTKPKPKG